MAEFKYISIIKGVTRHIAVIDSETMETLYKGNDREEAKKAFRNTTCNNIMLVGTAKAINYIQK